MTMGERIKEFREKAGLTQEQLGEKIGVQKSAIRKYEKGSVENIKRSSIKTMAQLFGVTPSYLMWGDERDSDTPSPQSPASDRDRVAAIFSSLTEENQKRLLDFARVLLKAQGTEDEGKKEEK